MALDFAFEHMGLGFETAYCHEGLDTINTKCCVRVSCMMLDVNGANLTWSTHLI